MFVLLGFISIVPVVPTSNIIDLHNIINKVISSTLCSFTPCTVRVVVMQGIDCPEFDWDSG